MPPATNTTTNTNSLGWKFFFGLLMLIQTLGVGILWRTYDAVTNTRAVVAEHELELKRIVHPALHNHDARLKLLEDRKP